MRFPGKTLLDAGLGALGDRLNKKDQKQDAEEESEEDKPDGKAGQVKEVLDFLGGGILKKKPKTEEEPKPKE